MSEKAYYDSWKTKPDFTSEDVETLIKMFPKKKRKFFIFKKYKK